MNRAAEIFEDISFWVGSKGWHQVYVGPSKSGGSRYRSQKSPGVKAACCRLLFEASSWVMRFCMDK
jgi:hypothetical protein